MWDDRLADARLTAVVWLAAAGLALAGDVALALVVRLAVAGVGPTT